VIRIVASHPTLGCRRDVPVEDLALLLTEPAWKVWVDLEQPDAEETSILRDIFQFHPLAIEDCEQLRHHPKIDDYDDYIFLIVHGVSPETSHRDFVTRELDLFLSSRYLVTYHNKKLRSIAAAHDACVKRPGLLAQGPDLLTHFILDSMVDRYLPVLDSFSKAMEDIEERMFQEDAPEMLPEILKVKKSLLRLRRVSGHQREILHRVARGEFAQIQERTSLYFRDVYDHMLRVTDLAEVYREQLSGTLNAYLSSASMRLNHTMKILTAFTAIFIPLTFIVGVYGMNFHYMPEVEWRYGYLFAWFLMIATGGGLFVYFRRKRVF